jgi:cytochrome c oxidase subunit 4
MAQHIVARRIYYGIFTALLVLTLLTVGVAFIDLGPLNPILAMTIAVAKALLVILFFMHVRYSSHLIWIYAAVGVIWLGHLIIFTMADYLSRGWTPISRGWMP